MAKIVVEEQPEYSLLPVDSVVTLVIKEVTVKEVQSARPWEKLEFTFEITGIQSTGDGSPVENYQSAVGSKIWGSVPFRLTDSAENKLRLWAEAILGMELGLGFELDTDYFEGRSVRGITGQYNKRMVDPKTGQPFKAHQVDSLLPIGGIQPQQQPVQQQPVQSVQPVQQQPVQQQQPAFANPWGSGDEPPF